MRPACRTRILSALSSASTPSLSTIARAEGLTEQTVFRIKTDPLAAEPALAGPRLWVHSPDRPSRKQP
jgi:hypothetical protein